jgi:hypothetical protein
MKSISVALHSFLDHSLLAPYYHLLLVLASLSHTKFYIPGETKELESLRKKAIGKGLLIFV